MSKIMGLGPYLKSLYGFLRSKSTASALPLPAPKLTDHERIGKLNPLKQPIGVGVGILPGRFQ